MLSLLIACNEHYETQALREPLQDLPARTQDQRKSHTSHDSMGSYESTPGKKVPLQDQSTQFVATDNSIVSKVGTCVRITPGGFQSTIKVVDEQTSKVLYQFNKLSSTRRTLETPSGQILLSLKRPIYSSAQRVYTGAQCDNELFRIEYELHVFSPSVIYAKFRDRLTQDACRVTIEGNSQDEVALIYFERGQGRLRTIDKHDDRTNTSRFQVIGRIRQPSSDEFPKGDHVVEIAAGVDVTLVLLIWFVRFEMELWRQLD